jgi:hypothetical protein
LEDLHLNYNKNQLNQFRQIKLTSGGKSMLEINNPKSPDKTSTMEINLDINQKTKTEDRFDMAVVIVILSTLSGAWLLGSMSL